MCGRYYWGKQTFEIVSDIVDESDKVENTEDDFYPGQDIPIVYMKDNQFIMTYKSWGYKQYMNPSLIINARSETLLEKKMFQEDALKRRCLVPAKGFYEWDTHKHKVLCESDDVLWLAGLYHDHNVVIITTKANQHMKVVHKRMPLVIQQKDIKKWLNDQDAFQDLLLSVCEDVNVVSGNVQQSLFED